MYDALNIAKYIICYTREKGKTISNLKLQKVLYFVQAEFLVTKDYPCFKEDIEAWDFGPVIPEVYNEYKIYGGCNIPVYGDNPHYGYIDKEDKALINGIIDETLCYSAAALTEISLHQYPWKKAYHKKGKYKKIKLKHIKYFFS